MCEMKIKDIKPFYVLEEIANKKIEPDNDVFYIKVKANYSTGYSWVVNYDKELKIVEYEGIVELEEENKEIVGMVGASIDEYHKFKILNNGIIKINFIYKRPWEKDKKPLKDISFEIVVKNNKK